MALMTFREPNRALWVGTRPAHNGEQIVKSKGAWNATQTVYTVPAGKVLYITHWNLSSSSDAAAQYTYFFIDTAVPALWAELCLHYFNAAGHKENNFNAMIPIEVPAGYIIKIQSSAANTRGYVFLHGWIEDA